MNQKTYLQVTGLFFTAAGVVHVLRILSGWSANIAGWDIPIWVSAVGVVVTGYLAYSAYKLMK